MKRMNPILMLGLGVLFLTVLYGGYLFYKKSAQGSEMKKLEATKTELVNQLTIFEAKNLEQAIAAKELMAYLDTGRMKWSEVIRQIRETLPKEDNGEYLVDVLSYSGTPDGQLNLSMQTVPASAEPYSKVARIIEVFDGSKVFTGNFVPSIGSGMTPFGQKILTFNMSTLYSPEKSETPVSGDETSTSDTKKISR